MKAKPRLALIQMLVFYFATLEIWPADLWIDLQHYCGVNDKSNKLPRFHAFQSILLSVVGARSDWNWIASLSPDYCAVMDISILSLLLIAGLLDLSVLAMLGAFMLMAAIKGFQGELFKIPVIGNFADQWSD